MVISWLVHSVSLSIHLSILWMDNVATIWNDLQHRFSQGDRSHISTLQMDAATLCQGDLSVSDYFTKLRIIWDELDNFRPDPICTCKPKCSCILSSVISLRKSEDQSMQILRGLNDNFHNIKTHMLLLEPLPPVTKIFSSVIQQERQFAAGSFTVSVRHTHQSPSTSFNASPNTGTNIFLATSSNTFNYCKRPGHNESACFRKNGFPNQDGKSSKTQIIREICTYCNRSGHTIDICFKKHGYPPRHKLHLGNHLKLITSPPKKQLLFPQILLVIFDLLLNSFNFFQIFFKNQLQLRPLHK